MENKEEELNEIIERRRYARLDKEMRFFYAPFADLTETELGEEGLLLDIGGGGLRFLADRKMDKNSQLVMQLDFEGWQEGEEEWIATGRKEDSGRMLVVGTVMWSAETAHEDQFEVGVRFNGRIHR